VEADFAAVGTSTSWLESSLGMSGGAEAYVPVISRQKDKFLVLRPGASRQLKFGVRGCNRCDLSQRDYAITSARAVRTWSELLWVFYSAGSMMLLPS